MGTQAITADYRLKQWAKVIQARKESGQTINDFCMASGVDKNAYYYWQRKLRKLAYAELTKTEEPKSIVPGGWMQLVPADPQHMGKELGIEVGGCHITVDTDTDLSLLKEICLMLKSL